MAGYEHREVNNSHLLVRTSLRDKFEEMPPVYVLRSGPYERFLYLDAEGLLALSQAEQAPQAELRDEKSKADPT